MTVDGLSLLGNVQHNSMKRVISLHSQSNATKPANSAVWHSFKQKVDLGFHMSFKFAVRMQRSAQNVRASRLDYRSESHSQSSGGARMRSSIFQAERDRIAE